MKKQLIWEVFNSLDKSIRIQCASNKPMKQDQLRQDNIVSRSLVSLRRRKSLVILKLMVSLDLHQSTMADL